MRRFLLTAALLIAPALSLGFSHGGAFPALPLTFSQIILNSGPKGFWKLNDSAGTTAVDSSGNGHDGTYSGGYTLGQAGLVTGMGTSVAFDGIDGQVQIPYHSDFSPVNGFTIMIWMKTSNTTDGGLFGMAWNGSTEYGLYNTAVQWGWVYDGVHAYNVAQSATDPRNGTRHMIVRRWAPGTTGDIWIDGTNEANGDHSDTVPGVGSGVLNIGQWNASFGIHYKSFTGAAAAVWSYTIDGSVIMSAWQAGQ